MDIESIVRELDFEIEKLQRIRQIIQGLLSPARRIRPGKKSAPKSIVLTQSAIDKQESRVTILPPKVKREYRRTIRPNSQMPNALGAPIPVRPVFVPRIVPKHEHLSQAKELNLEILEAAVRHRLLGNAS